MRGLYSEFEAPVFFPSMEECWEQLQARNVDIIVLGAERTGQPHHGAPVVRGGFHVMGEMSMPLSCNLYVKPGSRPEAIKKILGHGSVRQCTAYLDKNFPGVPREMHGLNSVEAAKAVAAGDGTLAVVGSSSLPQLVGGLHRFAEGIDDGAVANWWAVSAEPFFDSRPDTVIVSGRFGADGDLGRTIAPIAACGFCLSIAAAFPVNEGVSIYDYLLTFRGEGDVADVKRAVGQTAGARLAGAFRRRTASA